MIMIIANEDRIRLFEYTRLKIVIAKVSRIIQIWIVSKNIIYSMILSKSWLRNVTTIDLYEFDEYWIKDVIVEDYKKMKVFDSRKSEREKMYEIEIDVSLTQNVDEKTLIDLKYEKEERVEKILRQIIKEAKKEMWNEKINLMMKIEMKNTEKKKALFFRRYWDVEWIKRITQRKSRRSKRMTSTWRWKVMKYDRTTRDQKRDWLEQCWKWRVTKSRMLTIIKRIQICRRATQWHLDFLS